MVLRHWNRWRWWNWVGFVLAGLFALNLVVTLVVRLVESFALLSGRAASLPERSDLPLWILAGQAVVTVAWMHFAMPWFGSSRTWFSDRRTPRVLARAYVASLWMPAGIAAMLVGTNYTPVYLGYRTVAQWQRAQPWLEWAVWMPLVFAVPAIVLMGPIRARLRVRAAAVERCSACGYHYAGVASDVCPECGLALPDEPPDEQYA
ncbi:MAG: hypothetical protein AAF432_15655 [Planctomycetota bacterium]